MTRPESPNSSTSVPKPLPEAAAESAAVGPADRRNFLVKALAVIVGGVVTLVPLAAGIAFFFDPFLRKKASSLRDPEAKRDAEGFLRVTTVAALPVDGEPQTFTVFDDLVDAWNKFSDQPVGRVFLRRLPDGSVTAFNVRCTHLGCPIDFRPAEADYFCFCHSSSFDLNGERKNTIPPRNMDRLEVKIKNGTDVWVRFKSFKAGTPDQIPV